MRLREAHMPTCGIWGRYTAANRNASVIQSDALYSSGLGDHFGTKNGVFRVFILVVS